MREDIFEFKLNGQMSDGQTVVFLQSITNVLQSTLQKKLSLWWKMVLLEVKKIKWNKSVHKNGNLPIDISHDL